MKNSILDLLKSTYDLYKNIKTAIIIDRQTNLNHELYDPLIKKQICFHYYTLDASITDARIIKTKLNKYTLYSTSNKDLIHERVLLIGSLIITMDEDPFNIPHRNTWSITIQYCKKTSNIIIKEKCKKFQKSLF